MSTFFRSEIHTHEEESKAASIYLNEEVPCPQTSPPGHALHINRLQILKGRECRGGGELLNGCLGWEEIV